MMTSSKRAAIVVVALILLVPVVLLQSWIDPRRHKFEPAITNMDQGVQQLPIEFALGAVLGFREAVASMLWVRTDEFFDEGNYDAIVPMVRIITWLDPHNLDVYETGAWHMDYNFTDSEQRSDRRYIPFSLSLLKEGIANNPDVPDLYSELAFTHYVRKIEDYPAAVEWYSKAQNLTETDPDTGKVVPIPWDPVTVGHGLAHAYEMEGDYKDAIATWQLCVQKSKQAYEADPKNAMQQQDYSTSVKNLQEDILRAKWRAVQDTPPWDVHLNAELIRIAPMVFVIQGTANIIGATAFDLKTGDHTGLPNATAPKPGEHTWGPIDGARIEYRLEDAGYVMPQATSFSLNLALPKNLTIMQDSVTIQQGKFHRQIDMSKDHTGDEAMYSFTAPKYTFTCWFNTGDVMDCPPNVTDRFDWAGQGMTDRKYLYTGGNLPGTGGSQENGMRMVELQFDLTREDCLGSGIKTFYPHAVTVGLQ